ARRFQLPASQLPCRGRDALFGYPATAQLVLYPARPEPGPAGMDDLLGKARLGQPPALLELVEKPLDFGGVFGVLRELAAEFAAGMVAPREDLERPGAQAFSHPPSSLPS